MALRFASWSIFLPILLLMYCGHGSGARDGLKYPMDDGIAEGTNVLRLGSMDGDDKQIHIDTEHVHAHPSSHMDHIHSSPTLFLVLEDLKVGKTMPLYFPERDFSSSPHFLPREEADSIPFSLKQLTQLLQYFSFSRGSRQAIAMEDTLGKCDSRAMKGEVKHCATSLESMLDFARGVFGLETQFKVLSTTQLTKTHTSSTQNYTVLRMLQEISAPKMVACHAMPYPYLVFYCHSQFSESKVFEVLLGGEDGDRVEAVVVCHLDTSQWSPSHMSFRVLGIEPGTSPVCHFLPWNNLIWVPINNA